MQGCKISSMAIEATLSKPFSIRAGQQLHTVMNNNLTGDANLSDQRMKAMLLAASGITKKEFLGQEAVSEKTFCSLGWIAETAKELFKQLTPKNGKLPSLPNDLTQALAETQEGQQWLKEESTVKLKSLLVNAFANGKQPELTHQEGNLIKVIKVGNTEIKIISPGIVGLNEHRNYKISASIKGEELRATVDLKNNQDLFQQLWDFDLKHDQPFQTPEILTLEELQTVIKEGTIVNAILLNREISPPDAYPTDTIQLHLKHNDKLQYFTMKYTGHTQKDPYDVACILEIGDGTSRNFNGVQLDASTASLRDAAEELIKTKLKAFNDEYLISY